MSIVKISCVCTRFVRLNQLGVKRGLALTMLLDIPLQLILIVRLYDVHLSNLTH